MNIQIEIRREYYDGNEDKAGNENKTSNALSSPQVTVAAVAFIRAIGDALLSEHIRGVQIEITDLQSARRLASEAF